MYKCEANFKSEEQIVNVWTKILICRGNYENVKKILTVEKIAKLYMQL